MQDPLEHGGGRGDDGGDENNKGAHHDPAGNIIRAAHEYENVSFRTDDKERRQSRAIFYGPQSSNGGLGKHLVPSRISQYLECLIQTDKEWDEGEVYIRQEWVFEIYLKLRSVHIPAFELWFPKQQGKHADAENYNYYLEEDR